MPRLSTADRRGVEEVRDLLAVVDIRQSSGSDWMQPFKELLLLDQFMLYALTPGEEHLDLARFDTLGFPSRAATEITAFLRALPTNYAFFDPLRPAEWQRNRALSEAQLEAGTGLPLPAALRLVKQLLSPKTEQLRVLVCDGPAMVAWVGGLREGTFAARDVQVLEAIAPVLCRRLVVDQALNLSSAYRELFGVALQNVGAPSYLANKRGGMVHANAAGMAKWERDPLATKAALGRMVKRAQRGHQLPSVSATQVDGYWLLVDRSDTDGRLEAKVLAWCIARQLTPRQQQVTRLLARGATNATIAAILECSERTVEVHVSAILSRVGAENRAEIIAQILMY